MVVVAVAGGLGDIGRLIVQALVASRKHHVFVLSRKKNDARAQNLSAATERVPSIVETDYSQESLTAELSARSVEVVISALIMDSDSASEAQVKLIRAAERAESVTRFIPSEFNVEYDVGDHVLPYPEKKFHIVARRELERNTTTLEYTYFYPGMFMDYFGLPRVASTLRPLYFFLDPAHGRAVLPGDGEGRMSMTFTTDAARYLVMALDLDKWPRVLKAVANTVSLNVLVKIVESTLGHNIEITYQPVEDLLQHKTIDLPSNVEVASQYPERFPGGLEQVRALVADLEAGVALGAYDLEQTNEHVNLVELFKDKAPPPRRIEEVIQEAWGT